MHTKNRTVTQLQYTRMFCRICQLIILFQQPINCSRSAQTWRLQFLWLVPRDSLRSQGKMKEKLPYSDDQMIKLIEHVLGMKCEIMLLKEEMMDIVKEEKDGEVHNIDNDMYWWHDRSMDQDQEERPLRREDWGSRESWRSGRGRWGRSRRWGTERWDESVNV